MALRPGATNRDITDLERHAGVVFSSTVREFYLTHDGQDGSGLMFGQSLLSIAAVRAKWDVWRSLDEEAMNADCAEFMRSDPPGVIRPMYCNRAWVPLTHDHSGNHIGLDFDPGRIGARGQIIAFGRDEDTKRLIAENFDMLLELHVAWLGRANWNGSSLHGPDVGWASR